MRGGRKVTGMGKRLAPGLPLVSIITVVKNGESSLERAIEGVNRQTYPNREQIVVDGGSTDRTVEILGNHEEIDLWISGADRGIYDAMDKGIDASSGAWLYFLGVDDAFKDPDTLASVFGAGHALEGVDLIVGNVLTPRGLFRGRFGRGLYLENTVHHQGVFYRRNVFDGFRYCGATGPYRPGWCYAISGDYRLNLMLFRRGARALHLDRVFATCGSGASMEGRFIGYWEEILIRHEQIGHVWSPFFDLLTLLRYLCGKFRTWSSPPGRTR